MKQIREFTCGICKGNLHFEYLNDEKTLYEFKCDSCHNTFIAKEVDSKFIRVNQDVKVVL